MRTTYVFRTYWLVAALSSVANTGTSVRSHVRTEVKIAGVVEDVGDLYCF